MGTPIKLNTDELRNIAAKIAACETVASQKWQVAVAETESLIRERPFCDPYGGVVRPWIDETAGGLAALKGRLAESTDKLLGVVKLFEEIDSQSAAGMQALEARFPELAGNPDLALAILVAMTTEQVTNYLHYGDLMAGGWDADLGDLFLALQSQVALLNPECLKDDPEALRYWVMNTFDPEALLDYLMNTFDPQQPDLTREAEDHLAAVVEQHYGISFGESWPPGMRIMAAAAVVDAGKAFSAELNYKDGGTAFREVFGTGPTDHLFLVWGTLTPTLAKQEKNWIYGEGNYISQGGFTTSKHMINFASLGGMNSAYSVKNKTREQWNAAFQRGRNTVVHEMGHAFTDLWIDDKGWLPTKPDNEMAHEEDVQLKNNLISDYGFYGHTPESPYVDDWRLHPKGWAGETYTPPGEFFADSFVGWVYDSWPEGSEQVNPEASSLGTDGSSRRLNPGLTDMTREEKMALHIQIGRERKEYMHSHMAEWVDEAAAGKIRREEE